jgi:hypothetical protein
MDTPKKLDIKHQGHTKQQKRNFFFVAVRMLGVHQALTKVKSV